MRITDKYVFFYKDWLSNYQKTQFYFPSYDCPMWCFKTTEQGFMFFKALTFGDYKIAEEIYNSGEGQFWRDASVFTKYLTQLSPKELICLNQEYNYIAKHTILQAIDKEFIGDSKKAFRAIVYANLLPSEYFATRVHDAIKGIGTKDHLLMRVLITRDEIDMPQIKECYKKLYGVSMIDAIKNDISGNYRKLMLELCHH